MKTIPNSAECVRICEAIANYWGDQDECEAPIWPDADIIDHKPIKELVRVALGRPAKGKPVTYVGPSLFWYPGED